MAGTGSKSAAVAVSVRFDCSPEIHLDIAGDRQIESRRHKSQQRLVTDQDSGTVRNSRVGRPLQFR